VAQYRCYFFDADDHVFEVDSADHPTDQHAIAWGHRLSRSHPKCTSIELWCGARLIDRQPCVSAAE